MCLSMFKCGCARARAKRHHSLALEVENLDTRSSSSAQPVPVGREDKRIDDIPSLERVEMTALVQVPKHGDTVLAARGGKGSVGRDGKSVDVASVTVVVGLQLAFGQLPDLFALAWGFQTMSR